MKAVEAHEAAPLQKPGYTFCKRNGVLITTEADGSPVVLVREGASIDAFMEVQRLNAGTLPVRRCDAAAFDLELQRAYEQGEGAAAELVEGLGDH